MFCIHQVVTNVENDVSPSRLIFAIVGVVILLAHTFLYCHAGEIITEQVSNTSYSKHIEEF